MNVAFDPDAWLDLLYWSKADAKILRRILALIEECRRTPFEGIAKPEPLKNRWAGCWSRRIDQEHRLVYQVKGSTLVIAQCRYHYES